MAEYLIYMWQAENLKRANSSDIRRLREQIFDSHTEAQRPSLGAW